MHKRARPWTVWLGAAIPLTALAVGAALLVSARGAEADTQSLKNEVSGLKSQAGVGRLVAEQALAGNVTRTFVEAQSEQMLKRVGATREKLAPAEFEPALGAEVMRAGDLALRLEGALKALRASGGERGEVESAGKSLAGLYAELSETEEGLKR